MAASEASEIIERLIAKGLRIEDIASKTGISFETIHRYRRDGSVPYPLYLKSLQKLEAKEIGKSK